jgi:hypothetical protein
MSRSPASRLRIQLGTDATTLAGWSEGRKTWCVIGSTKAGFDIASIAAALAGVLIDRAQ